VLKSLLCLVLVESRLLPGGRTATAARLEIADPRHAHKNISAIAGLHGQGADAPSLVLLHGVGANSMHWRFQLAGLSDRFRVIAWNAPGYMLSDALA
jgi:pimeloyl-ACP methyl ester carboxylesterase